MTTVEKIISGICEPVVELLPQVAWRSFASVECGAKAMTTGTATFAPGERLIYHTHPFSEAVTVLEGKALCSVEGRTYLLHPLDCLHVPAGLAHEAVNASTTAPLVVLSAFASSNLTRDLVSNQFEKKERMNRNPESTDPEHITRFSTGSGYELAPGAEFCDLFAGRYGSVGICGGYGKFQPGTSLPCHTHDYDESITIIEGEAICEVAGRQYRLSGCDTAFVPKGKPHRFLNESNRPMAMIWVYAGSEPSRSIVDVEYCTGLQYMERLALSESRFARDPQ